MDHEYELTATGELPRVSVDDTGGPPRPGRLVRRVRLGLKLLLFLGVAYFALVAVVPELRRAAGELQNLNPPHSYTIAGEGKGGIAGFAKGVADVSLAEDGPDATILTYNAKADVGGKIAQLGSRLIQSSSKKLAGEFFSSFNETVSAS